MNSKDLFNRLKQLQRYLPKFPDGRIDYHGSKTAIVANIVVKYKDKILLLKRSNKVLAYKNKWNSIGAYLDELKPLEQKAKEEIWEELRIPESLINQIKTGKSFQFTDSDVGVTWIIYPVLAILREKPRVRLNWEHTEYVWVTLDEISRFDTVPGLSYVLKTLAL